MHEKKIWAGSTGSRKHHFFRITIGGVVMFWLWSAPAEAVSGTATLCLNEKGNFDSRLPTGPSWTTMTIISHILVLLGWTHKGAENAFGVWGPCWATSRLWAAALKMPRSHQPMSTMATIFQNVSDPQAALIEARQCFVSHCHKRQECSDLYSRRWSD